MKLFFMYSVIAVAILFAQSCGQRSVNGVSRPSIYTNVTSYLAGFPIGIASKDEVIEVLGVPDKSSEINGTLYISYSFGHEFGKREYVYVIRNIIVEDVKYHDQGPYNGSSAKNLQGKKTP